MGIANVGWLAALILLLRRNRARAVPHSGLIIGAVILNLLVWCIAILGPGWTITPHSSYADIIAISIGLLVAKYLKANEMRVSIAENGRANMQHLFDKKWVSVNPVERLFWQTVNGLSTRGAPPLTQFAYSEVA